MAVACRRGLFGTGGLTRFAMPPPGRVLPNTSKESKESKNSDLRVGLSIVRVILVELE
jgi:hypothetical protein